MNSLKQKASNLLALSSSKSGGPSAGSPSKPQASSAQANPELLKTFLQASSKQDVDDRRNLLHQEAVAGITQTYAMDLARVFGDLAAIHSRLHQSLQQAGDLVSEHCTLRVGAVAAGLQRYAEETQYRMEEASKPLKEAHEWHLTSVQQLVESDAAGRRREHYERKVEQMRAAAAKAADSYSAGALNPESNAGETASGSALPKRSYSGLKTMQADLKVGRLMRNESKLTQMVQKHDQAEAKATGTAERTLTVIRRQLRDSIDKVLAQALEEVLGGFQAALTLAERTASEMCAASSGTSKALCAFAVGERVTVTGLVSAPQHNGCDGIVQRLRDDGRIEVALMAANAGYPAESAAGKILSLKPDCLIRSKEPNSEMPLALLDLGCEWLQLADIQGAADVLSGDSSDGGN